MKVFDPGTFTQTVAFADEESARAGEQAERPTEADEYFAQLRDLTFIDLRNPWFESH